MTVFELVEFLKTQDPEMVVVKDDGTEGVIGIDDIQVIEVRDFGNGEYDYPVQYTAYPEIPLTKAVIVR